MSCISENNIHQLIRSSAEDKIFFLMEALDFSVKMFKNKFNIIIYHYAPKSATTKTKTFYRIFYVFYELFLKYFANTNSFKKLLDNIRIK